jgi:hypothetical protein
MWHKEMYYCNDEQVYLMLVVHCDVMSNGVAEAKLVVIERS